MSAGSAFPDLPRQRPDPLPAIHPLPEYAVSGERARWYEDLKRALQVPWMGVVTMTYAHYPAFFAELWRGLEPLVTSRPFVEACAANRSHIEEAVGALSPAPIGKRLAALGYAPRELDSIRTMIEIFSHGNQPYALIATVVRVLLEGGEMGGPVAPAPPYRGRHAPAANGPFVLMEAHPADPATQACYDDIRRVLGLPFVNTDYRALARWPSYWRAAWSELREVAGSAAHEAICANYHARCLTQAARKLPNPGGLDGPRLRRAASIDASLEELVAVARLFQWLLPGLITNIAYLRAQIVTGAER